LKARDEMNVSCNVTQVRHGRQVRWERQVRCINFSDILSTRKPG
jgi:hypothetical protein